MQLKPHWNPEAIDRGRDRLVGARLTQLTSAAMISQDIYCEERYTSADGSRIAFLRSATGSGEQQLWVYDEPSRQVALVSERVHGYPTSALFSDRLYFMCRSAGGSSDRLLMRIDLGTLEMEEVFDLQKCPPWRWSVATVSPDDRYFVSNFRCGGDVYGLYRVDLQRGTWEAFHEHPHILNPHPQFEPVHGRDILVQHNRGGHFDEEGNIVRLVGEEGATLYVIDRDGGNIRRLPVGKPHTPPVTGHECWVGRTGKVILTTDGDEVHVADPAAPEGTPSRCVWRGACRFGHIAASSDGRYWISDDFNNGVLYVGSLASGKVLPLCESGATCSMPQHTHTHAYMTPDNRRVIFNSDRGGLCQVWSAEVPEGFLAALDHAG